MPFRILLVDDSANSHDDLRRILLRPNAAAMSQMEDDLFGAPSGQVEEVLEFALEDAFQGLVAVSKVADSARSGNPFAVAFVDIRMPPGIDGLETVQQIWKIDPRIQVVLCAADSEYSWSQMAARLGHNDRWVVLLKPLDHIEVLQLAHVLARKWRDAEEKKDRVKQLEHLLAERTQALHDHQMLFHQLLESSSDLICILDKRHLVTFASRSHETILGYAPDELLGRAGLSFLHPDDFSVGEALLVPPHDLSSRGTGIVRLRHKNGTWPRFEVSVGVVPNDLDEVIYCVVVAHPVPTTAEIDCGAL